MTDMSRPALHHAYANGSTPGAVVRDAFARIAADGDEGVFIHLLPQEAVLAHIARLPPFDPARYPLWGLPFAIKDNIDLAGAPTTAACPGFSRTPAISATVVSKLIDAGAIPLGKTNLDQFATGLVGVRTPYPVPRNAFDTTRVPGGSSSGSAVAVAKGFVSFALGTDTAGSGRIPAAFNNLVGLKPSLGALSTTGVVPACRTLDCVSVFALTVEDARIVFDAGQGFDPADAYSRRLPQQDAPLRVLGVPRPVDLLFFGDELMAEAWKAAARQLAGLGLVIREIDMTPFFAVARMLYDGPWVAERRAAVGAFMDAHADAMHPTTRAILGGADRHSAVDAFNAFYKLADLRRACEQALEGVDALAVPTAPIFPTLAELADDPIGPNSRLGTYTNFVNLLDLAAIAAPGPFRADGLPAGVTFIGRAGSDHALATLAAAFFRGIGGQTGVGAGDIRRAS
jgi:allophanate hydrolase